MRPAMVELRGMGMNMARLLLQSDHEVVARNGLPDILRKWFTREKAETVKALYQGSEPQLPAAKIKPLQGAMI